MTQTSKQPGAGRGICRYVVGRRFAFMYFMADRPQDIARIAPLHAAYWQRLELGGYTGGPFSDHCGGLITFLAEDRSQADAAIGADPFVTEGLVEHSWLREWRPEGSTIGEEVAIPIRSRSSG
jgi:uncharacterized protein YciI